MGWLSDNEISEARQILERFDVFYDCQLAWHKATGQLEQLGVYSDEALEAATLLENAVVLGGLWCRLVAADVRYALDEGRRLMSLGRGVLRRITETQLSSIDAGTIKKAIDERAQAIEPRDRQFVFYVIVRWLDGCSKIHYRHGDMTAARRTSEPAVALARAENIWWCLPDVESNLERYIQDEPNPTAHQGAVGQDSRRYIMLIEKHFKAARSFFGGGELPALPKIVEWVKLHQTRGGFSVLQREFLRGVCSLLHNAATTSKGSTLDERLGWSTQVEAVTSLLGDEYRNLQSIQCQGQLHLNRSKMSTGDASAARAAAITCFQRLNEQNRWRRGRFFGRQNLAIVNEDSAELEQLVKEFRSIPGGIQDVAAYLWTLSEWIRIAPPDKPDDYRLLWRIDAIRSVTSVPQYKKHLASQVHPAFLKLSTWCHGMASNLEQRFEKEDPKAGILDVVERYAARELLDLLASGRSRSTVKPEIITIDKQTIEKVCNERLRLGERLAPLSLTEEATQEQWELIGQKIDEVRGREEEYWLNNPIPTQVAVEGIGQELLQFSAHNRRTLILRYYEIEDGERGRRYAVIGAWNGRWVGPCELDSGIERELTNCMGDLNEAVRAKEYAPYGRILLAFGELIWRRLISPVLQREEVREGEQRGLSAIRRIVIIPIGRLFDVPFQAAIVPGGAGVSRPLISHVPVSACVSLEALVARRRWFNRVYQKSTSDDIIVVDPFKIVDQSIFNDQRCMCIRSDTAERFADLVEKQPEFLILAGHGTLLPERGPVLILGDCLLTQYGIAASRWLPRNKLTILLACVSGRESWLATGETAGFVRGLMCAGARAIMSTSWHVHRMLASETLGRLFERLEQPHDQPDHGLDDLLHELALEQVDRSTSEQLERSPFLLYV